MNYHDVINFWFTELAPEQWFRVDKQLDHNIHTRFLPLIEAAAQGELYAWRRTPEGRLAEILVLDQFPRNAFRGSPRAWAYDSLALVLAQELVGLQWDQKLSLPQRAFAYMPYMHSESLLIHQEAERLFSTPGLEDNLAYEIQHQQVIARFGRYPHRNHILGRSSTLDEVEFLKEHAGW
jgi:uncharacterized protein (DUF924 family)